MCLPILCVTKRGLRAPKPSACALPMLQLCRILLRSLPCPSLGTPQERMPVPCRAHNPNT